MAYDAESYTLDPAGSRTKRRKKRLARMSEEASTPKRGPHGGLRGGGALRHPRRKKGKYFAA